MVESCMQYAQQCGRDMLGRWRAKAMRVHQAANELLSSLDAQELRAARRVERGKRMRDRRRSAASAAGSLAGSLTGSTAPEDEECIVCLDAARTYVFRPCGHRVSCQVCALALLSRVDTCPWCRAPVVI